MVEEFVNFNQISRSIIKCCCQLQIRLALVVDAPDGSWLLLQRNLPLLVAEFVTKRYQTWNHCWNSFQLRVETTARDCWWFIVIIAIRLVLQTAYFEYHFLVDFALVSQPTDCRIFQNLSVLLLCFLRLVLASTPLLECCPYSVASHRPIWTTMLRLARSWPPARGYSNRSCHIF